MTPGERFRNWLDDIEDTWVQIVFMIVTVFVAIILLMMVFAPIAWVISKTIVPLMEFWYNWWKP